RDQRQGGRDGRAGPAPHRRLPTRAVGTATVGHPRGTAPGVLEMAAQLGARDEARVSRHHRALGAGGASGASGRMRAHRVGTATTATALGAASATGTARARSATTVPEANWRGPTRTPASRSHM